ncbi:hypothetical protein ABEB36_011167 [Hypothenemus hampei]|uniref:Trafficking protein particle complex subunit 8 n=1 Tax=Hypothenemus hampei TaxID=57062 RepID=A0ABD1EH89_HYPHA
MAQCKSTPEEFIKNSFTPQIAVMCTPEVQRCCKKNNLNFTEILQPFSKLIHDVNYKDQSGVVHIIKNLQLTFTDIKAKPPQKTVAKKLLDSSVSRVSDFNMKQYESKNINLEIPAATPWYENWRDMFLKIQYPSDHEFTRHILACLLVVSSTDNNPFDEILKLTQNLNQMLSTTSENSIKWFNTNVLKYYVVLHDNVEGNHLNANSTFDTLKSQYGSPNCFLLKLNSRINGDNNEHLTDPWNQFLCNKIEDHTPESSPSSEKLNLEIGQEAKESKNLVVHPLSLKIDDISDNLEFEKEERETKLEIGKYGHGNCLSMDDVEQIKMLIYEFAKSCLLPYVEKQISILHEAVANKKGVSKSLLTATKRWFSASKPNTNALAVNNLIYSVGSSELQIRKLGDLYFMFGNYPAAFQAYHTAKREYNADQAWLYYAGALEMAALSAFMCNESTRKTLDYMEESITTYLDACKMHQFATRATLLSSECLKSKKLYGEAAHQFIRMTSEDSDLCSALLLEQASYCFIHSNMLRKYAFHMVLSGHRFFKAIQKIHALRCYEQAYQMYENSGWDLANEHIHYTVGRLANFLQNFDDAIIPFAKLLTGVSRQSTAQQASFLKEFLVILLNKLKNDTTSEMPILPVPSLKNSSLKVLLGPTRPLSTPGKLPALGINFNTSDDPDSERRWHKLEEILLEQSGNAPLIFKPLISLYKASSIENDPLIAIINEPIQVSLELDNLLQIPLVLKDLHLVWNYKDAESEVVTNLIENELADVHVKTYVVKSVIIQENSSQNVVLSVTPLRTGILTITAICYTLAASPNDNETLFVKGIKQLNICGNVNVPTPINLKIVPYAPCLQMTFSELNMDFLTGELQRVSIDLHNNGSVSLKNVMIATSVPHLLSNCELNTNQKNYFTSDIDPSVNKDQWSRKNHITSIPLPEGQLDKGQSVSFHIWLRAPDVKGHSSIDLLTYYENIDSKSVPRYRLIRHSWNLSVQESIALNISAQNSYNSNKSQDLVLALKCTNLNKIHQSISTEITLLNLALLSVNWVLTQDIVTPTYINLNSQESAHILFKARREVSKIDRYTHISLSSEQPTLPHLTTAYKAFAKKSRTGLLNIFNSNSNNKTSDGTLILEWKALVSDASNKRIVYGHTYKPLQVNQDELKLDQLISDTCIDLYSSTVSQNEDSKNVQNQVIYNLLYPSVINYDFQRRGSCIVPVTLILHSLVNEEIVVTINTINTSSNAKKPFNTNVCWISKGKIIRNIEPLATISVELSVILVHSGTFHLGSNLEILCNSLNKVDIPVLQVQDVPFKLVAINSEIY